MIINREIAYRNIVEWLYANDGKYQSKLEWRARLLDVLRFNVLGGKSVTIKNLDALK